jgi:hypothetical protein
MSDMQQMSPDERAAAIKRAEAEGRKGIGQPGVESALGRDRSMGELPRNFGTNANDANIDAVAPAPNTVQGTRVGPGGDPTGAPESDERG